ncbi:WD40-repeat-containing domain protein [Suillus variegatus]|nr:WD40-repeat-containing domain protein [Suillus variegatus]
MSVPTNKKQTTPAVTPRQTMRGHTDKVQGVVHLPGGRRIMTCSCDRSLRLWDLESGAQIDEDRRDEEDMAEVVSMALSPSGKTIVSGSYDGKVELWDVETGKVVARWTGHTRYELVTSVCWSADGKRVLSGSWDGTARVWDVHVKTGKTILTIQTGHFDVYTAIYSPDQTQIGTGGYNEDAVKIWDAQTGELLATLKHESIVFNLAWTSDGKKLISAGYGPIRIHDTTTWQQVATLEGHTYWVNIINLFKNDRLLVSASDENTVRLWNLDTNLQVGPPIQHDHRLICAALSADGKLLVTGSEDKNAYVWDIHAILKDAGLEDLLSIPHVLTQKSLKDTDATRRPPIQARRIPPGFFEDTQSSTVRGTHTLSPVHNPRSSRPSLSAIPRAVLARLSSFFHPSHPSADRETELRERPRRSIFSHGPRIVEVATVQDRKALYVAPRPRPQQQSQSHVQASLSQSQPIATSTNTPAQGTSTAAQGAATTQSPPIPFRYLTNDFLHPNLPRAYGLHEPFNVTPNLGEVLALISSD